MALLDLPQIVATVLGGVISLFGALVMFWLANRKERLERQREDRKQKSDLAYIGLLKIIKSANVIENIARHVDEEIRQASARGLQTNEIASVVRPSIGGIIHLDDTLPSELAFLVPSHHDLVAEVWEIQQRARSHQAVLEEYNRDRREYDEWMLQVSTGASDVDGTRASFEIGPEMRAKSDLKLGKLNQIVTGLIVGLDEDRVAVKAIVSRYIEKARESFGEDFPVKQVAWKDPKE